MEKLKLTITLGILCVLLNSQGIHKHPHKQAIWKSQTVFTPNLRAFKSLWAMAGNWIKVVVQCEKLQVWGFVEEQSNWNTNNKTKNNKKENGREKNNNSDQVSHNIKQQK